MEQCAFGNSRMLSILKQVRNQLMTRLVSREEQAKKRQVEKKPADGWTKMNAGGAIDSRTAAPARMTLLFYIAGQVYGAM